MVNVFVILVVIALTVALCGLGPLLTIFSLNALFSLSIPINLSTWCAMVWLHWLAFGQRAVDAYNKAKNNA